jgi:predicted TIM-barrel fold metal-dependent hydrolase
MDKLGAAAAHLGIPVVFHDGTPPNSSPLQIAYFAERNPEVPVVLGHGGLHDLWVEALVALERVPNLLVCPSGTPPAFVARLIDSIGCSRILFGSDIGYGGTMNPAFQQNKIRHLGLDQAAEAAIFGGNAERLVPPLNFLSAEDGENA